MRETVAETETSDSETETDKARAGIQSLEVGFALLDVLTQTPGPLMLRDLAARAGMSAAKAHRYLVSFQRLGLVVQDSRTTRYDLGPAALKLGLAGGPLIMALILGRIGSIGKLYWFMPPSANLALRELGIVLFLAVVGLKSGGDFVATLTQGDGLSWIAYGIFITAIPLLTVGILARMLAKMNYLTLCGMLAGSMTDPPALAFANNLHATSGAAALSYATVYPLVMFLRIITPQLLAVLFWGLS